MSAFGSYRQRLLASDNETVSNNWETNPNLARSCRPSARNCLMTMMSRLSRLISWLVTPAVVVTLLAAGACHNEPSAPVPLFKEATNAAPEPAGPPFFEDVAAAAGIDHTYHNGQETGHFAILESLGGGVALLDFDGDGRLDIFLTGGGRFEGPDNKTITGLPCKLYRNLGNWKFE